MRSVTNKSRLAVIPLAVVSVATAMPLTLAGDSAGAMEASALLVTMGDSVVTQVADLARQLGESNSSQHVAMVGGHDTGLGADTDRSGVIISPAETQPHRLALRSDLISLPPPVC